MFDFGRANEAQKQAIVSVDGPVLITAGPGTGKTFTLVQRAVYMIQEKGVRPEQIMIATFTEKAAKEIITRITNELLERRIAVNLNEMYIGTFHSICLRFIKEHIEYTRIKKNYRTLDDFDQTYIVCQNIRRFRAMKDYDLAISEQGAWRQAQAICKCVNSLSEEMVEASALIEDHNPSIAAMGRILVEYQQILADNNMLDFSGIQTEAFRLLNDNDEVLQEVRDKIKYLMIDEYQDTNYIQEQLVFMLAGNEENICVVGDDDQGLYRFRGATIRNILEFPVKFVEGKCKIIPLTVNYRSNVDIVDFYNNWMQTTDGAKFKFSWDKYRYDKKIIAHNQERLSSPATIKLSVDNDVDDWQEAILDFINKLKASGKLTDLNQIAFLFKSVKSSKVKMLEQFLEANGINVYSPRSALLFERREVRLVFGAMLLTFPQYVARLEERDFDYYDDALCCYYEDCIREVSTLLKEEKYKPLRAFLKNKGKNHYSLRKNTDYAFAGLVYQLFEYEPFASILDIEMDSGLIDLRPARNISKLTEIFGKYEYLHRIDVFTPKKLNSDVELMFNMYFRFLFNGGIDEYEDDAEYAPSGCVSFLTIHQSKGMEFPVVVVGSLGSSPRSQNDILMDDIATRYYKRAPYEPIDQTKFFDFWRLYYTAFSRAQDLLVLMANETSREPSKYFREVYDDLMNYDSPKFDVTAFEFKEVKDVNIKDTYSFTSHIAVYENCSLQYKFFNELGFTPIRVGSTLFGQIVHQTIEDIHKASLRKETHLITEDNIRQWLLTNYITLSKNEHSYLGQPQIEAAIGQVNRYVDRQKGDWSLIQEAEVEVSLLKPDYIIKGKIDLIYIDPPFDSKADYKRKIEIKGVGKADSDNTSFEEKQYGDIWTNDEYLQFMYERLILLRELLSDSGTIYVHCDWHKAHHLRMLLDEVFGPSNFIDEIVWGYEDIGSRAVKYFKRKHDTILMYQKRDSEDRVFNIMRKRLSESTIKRYQPYFDKEGKITYRSLKESNPGVFAKLKGIPEDLDTPWLDVNNGAPLSDWWVDISALKNGFAEATSYPTQKPEALIERIIKASSNPGDLVFDCFMGSGTAQAVAMKLGRRFIGADINLGAIQTTTKRLVGVVDELTSTIGGTDGKYTGFEVYNVNNYEFFRNPLEAKELIISALEIQKFDSGSVYDGELDGRMVKILPVNRIATKADLEELKANLPYKTFERRKEENPSQPVERITLVCMGHEPDLKASLEQELSEYKLDVEIVDILRDKSVLQLKREAEARVVIQGNKLIIKEFYPMNLMQKLSLQKEYVEDWKQLVESVMIDWNYDGVVLEAKEIDIAEKDGFVQGLYTVPADAGRIKVKITDLLSESLEIEVG